MSRTFAEYSPQEKLDVTQQAHSSALQLLLAEEHKTMELENKLHYALDLLQDARFGKPFKKRADKFIRLLNRG